MGEDSNPFKMPTDEEVFALRDEEQQRKQQEQQLVLGGLAVASRVPAVKVEAALHPLPVVPLHLPPLLSLARLAAPIRTPASRPTTPPFLLPTSPGNDCASPRWSLKRDDNFFLLCLRVSFNLIPVVCVLNGTLLNVTVRCLLCY